MKTPCRRFVPDAWRLFCAPGGACFQRVKFPNLPGGGKDIAEGKGVRREVESEGMTGKGGMTVYDRKHKRWLFAKR